MYDCVRVCAYGLENPPRCLELIRWLSGYAAQRVVAVLAKADWTATEYVGYGSLVTTSVRLDK